MQWNYRKIEYFLKTAEILNFSKAAKELFISPQSLNKQILQFEEELGESLFYRTTRKMELTPFGKKMQQTFLPAREEFEQAARTMDHYMERRKRTVRIAFFQAISKKDAITPISNYLMGCESGLRIELLGGELDEVMQWLYQGKCDMIITNIHDFEIWENVEIIPFIHTPAKIVISFYHPWMVKEQITLADMEQGTILLIERKKELEKESFYRKLRVKERVYAPNFSSLLANLEMGTTYAVIPQLFESMNQMELKYLDLPKECEFYFRMSAIYPKDSRFASLFENLKNVVEEEIIKQ